MNGRIDFSSHADNYNVKPSVSIIRIRNIINNELVKT
jgi:hypothetical protein